MTTACNNQIIPELLSSFSNYWYFDLFFGILPLKIGYKSTERWLSEVKACQNEKKPEGPTFSQNNSISEIHDKDIVSLECLILSFCDSGCINKIGSTPSALSTIETCNYSLIKHCITRH